MWYVTCGRLGVRRLVLRATWAWSRVNVFVFGRDCVQVSLPLHKFHYGSMLPCTDASVWICRCVGTLRNVVRAVRDTWRQLLQTGLLVLFVIHCYAVIAFVYFRQYFVTADNELACNTLSACLYFTLEWGLLNGGGIGNSVGSASLEVPNWNYVRQVCLLARWTVPFDVDSREGCPVFRIPAHV